MKLRGQRRRHRQPTPHQRAQAERYKQHRHYSTRQLRQILVEDACSRVPTPLPWMLVAINLIAMAEHTTDEVVFASIRSECIAATGMDLPTAGII